MRRIVLLFILLISFGAVAAHAQQTPQSSPPAGQNAQQQGNPPVVSEVFNRAVAALEAQNFEQAAVDFSLYILFNPLDGRAYYGRAISYQSLGDLDHALVDLTQAVAYTDALPGLQSAVYAARAVVYQVNGQLAEALSDYDEAVALNPSIENYVARAQLHLSEDHFEDAVRDFDEAITLGQDNFPDLYLARAVAKNGLNQLAGAAGDYLAWVNGIQEQARDASPLEVGQPVTVEMARGAVYRIPIEVEAGDTISIAAVVVSGDVDPLVILTDADGNPVISSDDLPNGDLSAAISDYVVEEDGTYELVLSHARGGFTGRVTVLLENDHPVES